MRKWLMILCGIGALSVGALAIGLPRLAGADWVREQLEATLTSATGRPVDLGTIHFSWIDGLVVEDLIVLDPGSASDASDAFLRAEKLSLRVGFTELLARRLDIREFYLGSPRITIVRHADGRLSISDLLERGGSPPATDSPSVPATEGGGGAPEHDESHDSLAALRATIRLEGGSLLFIDHKLSSHWELEELSGRARLDGSRVTVELDGVLNEGPTHLEAEADLSTQSYRLTRLTVEQAALGAQFTQLAYLVPLFGKQPNAVGGKMDVTLEDLTASGQDAAQLASSLSGHGELRFEDGRLESQPLEEIVAALEAFGVDTGADPNVPGIEVTLLTSTFRVTDGRVYSEATLDAKGLDLEMQGSTGLDGSMDHRLIVLELNRVLEKNPELRKYVTNADQLPVTIKGTVDKPRIGIDAAEAVTDALADKLDDLISEGLDSLFGKKKKKRKHTEPSPE